MKKLQQSMKILQNVSNRELPPHERHLCYVMCFIMLFALSNSKEYLGTYLIFIENQFNNI